MSLRPLTAHFSDIGLNVEMRGWNTGFSLDDEGLILDLIGLAPSTLGLAHAEPTFSTHMEPLTLSITVQYSTVTGPTPD